MNNQLLRNITDVKKFHSPFLKAKKNKNRIRFLETLYISKKNIPKFTYIYSFLYLNNFIIKKTKIVPPLQLRTCYFLKRYF